MQQRLFTLDAGSGQTSVNVSASTVAALPEPGSLAMTLLALPLQGLGYRLSRRRDE